MLIESIPAHKRIYLSFFLIFAAILPFVSNSFAQTYTAKDMEICFSKFSFAVEKNLAEDSIGNVIVEIGKSFIGTEYEAFAIEKEGEEELVINLRGLDCTTFLENALVFGRLIKKGKNSFEDYMNELTFVRYRDGKINQYPSRLHYFSDWIFNNTSKNIVRDVTKEIGGKPIRFNLDFMSTHPESYLHLRENPKFVSTIKQHERSINQREYNFIPKERVSYLEASIQNGDLIAITTNIPGLDIGHTGIAVKGDDGRIYFMHAPITGSKVQITDEPLSKYLLKVKKHTGIIVLRPEEP
jgi:hypothetical protein